MDAEAGPATETVVAGGWARMASVRRAREAALPGLVFSDRDEDTAYGAALVAAFAADPRPTISPTPVQGQPTASHASTHNPHRRISHERHPHPDSSLDDIATDDGTFAVVAMDQRNTLKRMYAAVGVDDPSDEELVASRPTWSRPSAPSASAFLLDPTLRRPGARAVADDVRAEPRRPRRRRAARPGQVRRASPAAPATRARTPRGCAARAAPP